MTHRRLPRLERALELLHVLRSGMTALPAAWPQRLGKTWSSRIIAAAPACSSSCTVRTHVVLVAVAVVGVDDERHVDAMR